MNLWSIPSKDQGTEIKMYKFLNMKPKIKIKGKYIIPKITLRIIELEQGIAAGSGNIKTSPDKQGPNIRGWENGWTNGNDFDI